MNDARIAATILCCLLVADACAQWRVEPRAGRAAPEPVCPFTMPRLSSEDPVEVARAAYRLSRQLFDADKQAARSEALLLALRSMGAGNSAEHRSAVAHLLQAALQCDMTIPLAELRVEPEPCARTPWIALQVRAAAKDGRDLFELFRGLDQATDPAWEYVGGALAIRGHATFAIELRTHLRPTLHVVAGRRPNTPAVAVEWGRAEAPPGVPPAPEWWWERDDLRLVAPARNPSRVVKIDALAQERAQLRWLATLAGERDPLGWAARFEASFLDRDVAGFAAFAASVEKRARESLAAADAELRRRFKLPERLVLPELRIVREDCRRDADKQARPLPDAK